MNRRTKGVIAVVVLLGLLALAARWRQPEALAVPAVAVATGTVASTVANTRAGTIKACRRSGLSMSLGGRVETLRVTEGDRVEAGQVLLELWNKDHLANVAQAEASLSAARHEQQRACLSAEQNEREHQRARALYEKRLIASTAAEAARTLATTSQQGCQAASDQTRMSEANLALTRARLELTYLRAPYAGIVAEVNSELGEYVTPSPQGVLTLPAIELIDDSCLYVTAPIDEVDAMPVRVGQVATITLDAFRGQRFAGHVTRIAPYVMELEKQARTVDVDVRFDTFPKEVPLLVGYSADIEIVLDERRDVLRVPSEAVFDQRAVYVVDGLDEQRTGTVRRREFTPGLANWTHTEVLDGLQAGDWVVQTPDKPGLEDGARVRIDDSTSGAAAP